jgi:YegS/Rv2252/BmrU family lipid kinase
MYRALGDLVVAITDHPAQVADHLDKAVAAGLRRVIAVGGDGTTHAIVNAILQLEAQGESMVLGQLPIGTGQDFARSLKIPPKPEEAISWLARTVPRPIDVGLLEHDGRRRYFLNIASVGVSGYVGQQVHDAPRYPWTFWLATVRSFLTYQQARVQVSLDGEPWYEGSIWMVAVANGAIFGRGMAIAPEAKINDGLFDVVLVKGCSRLTALRAFNTVYSGKHLLRPEVELRQAKVVEITPLGDPLPLEADGEPDTTRKIRFTIQANILQMLSGA